MGTHRNGDNLPPDGDRSPDEPLDLPDLPSLPAGVVIPDDASALAAEAEQVRAQLSGEPLAVPVTPPPTSREPAPTMPLVIMSVAVVITMVSLFAMAWSGTTSPQPPDNPGAPLPADVVLTDDTGQPRSVAALAPVVILLVEACRSCEELIRETAAAAPAGVTVVMVTDGVDGPPERPVGTANVVRLSDPEIELRTALRLRPPPVSAATVVVADRQGVIRTVPSTTTMESYADVMASLGNR